MRRHLVQMARYAPPGGELLEIGCAYGFFLDEARHSYAKVSGIDIAGAAIQHAKRTLGLDVEARDFLELPPGRRADVICLWDTVEHLPRPEAVLEKARDVLAPGGWLFLTTGDIGSLNARLRGSRWRHIHPPSHLHYFSRATMRRLLERLGYEVGGFETASYYHTVYNVLASVGLRGGLRGALTSRAIRLLGPRLCQLGLWVNLGDTMFVAARSPRAQRT